MIGFLIGAMAGGSLGFVAAALVAAAHRSDMDQIRMAETHRRALSVVVEKARSN